MTYQEIRPPATTLTTAEAKSASIEIPGDFSTALSLVVTVSVGNLRIENGSPQYGPFLWVWLATFHDPDHPIYLNLPGGVAERVLTAKTHASWRLHGPFARRLKVRAGFRPQGSETTGGPFLEGTAENFAVVVGVQTLD